MMDRTSRPIGWTPPNMIPTVKLKDQSYICRWVRTHIFDGVPDLYAVRDHARRGWVPVKRDDIDTWTGRQPIPEANDNGLIETHGVALTMAPISFTQEDAKYYEDMATDAANAAENEFTADNNYPQMNKFMYSNRSVVVRGKNGYTIGEEPTEEELENDPNW